MQKLSKAHIVALSLLALLLGSALAWAAADPTYGPKVYMTDGGDTMEVVSGGKITVETGGTLTVAGVTIDASTLAMTGLTATAAEINKNAGVTAGTAAASKTAVLGADKNLDEFHTAALYLGAGAGAQVTATAAEINALTDMPASMTTTATPASGTCGVQFVLKNAAGSALSHAVAGTCYISGADGLSHGTAITGLAVLTNGALTELVTGKVAIFTSDATGKLGVTLTGAAGTYYLTLVLPSGKIITSSALVINA
ncbi:MAG: hypothetical protein HY794_18265 [Desulfarculus sp.]|nr:hypothetical protein [Desulfarculus sp.]